MAVEITVNWHFLGNEEDAEVSYSLGSPGRQADRSELEEHYVPAPGIVIPLGSSVLAPGLSKPVSA